MDWIPDSVKKHFLVNTFQKSWALKIMTLLYAAPKLDTLIRQEIFEYAFHFFYP